MVKHALTGEYQFITIRSILIKFQIYLHDFSLRYGLTIFSTYAARVYVGTSGYWGTPSELYTALGTYSSSGSQEDGYVGIDYVLRYYPFRTNAQRHIVLFTDEV